MIHPGRLTLSRYGKSMSRIATALPVTPKLYKHFAIVTLVITLGMAMFANGEGHQAVADEIAAREAKNQLLRDEATQIGPRHFRINNLKVRTNNKTYLPFAPDENQFIDETRGAVAAYGQNIGAGSAGTRLNPADYLRPDGAPGMGPNSQGAPPITLDTAPGGKINRPKVVKRAPPKLSTQQTESMMEAAQTRAGAASTE